MKQFLSVSFAAGFILMNFHYNGTYTIGYFSSEARCEHVKASIGSKPNSDFRCVPDDHELAEQGIK